jgi:transposase
MLPASVRIFIAAEPTDMRRSFDRLAEQTKNVIGQDPFAGHLFVFFNRPRDRVKILHWDRSGFWLYYKRLEDGSFRLPTTQRNVIEIEAAELALILEGIDLAGSQRQHRFALRKV